MTWCTIDMTSHNVAVPHAAKRWCWVAVVHVSAASNYLCQFLFVGGSSCYPWGVRPEMIELWVKKSLCIACHRANTYNLWYPPLIVMPHTCGLLEIAPSQVLHMQVTEAVKQCGHAVATVIARKGHRQLLSAGMGQGTFCWASAQSRPCGVLPASTL